MGPVERKLASMGEVVVRAHLVLLKKEILVLG